MIFLNKVEVSLGPLHTPGPLVGFLDGGGAKGTTHPPDFECGLGVWSFFCFPLPSSEVCDIIHFLSVTTGPGQNGHVYHDAEQGDAHLANHFGSLDLLHGPKLAG